MNTPKEQKKDNNEQARQKFYSCNEVIKLPQADCSAEQSINKPKPGKLVKIHPFKGSFHFEAHDSVSQQQDAYRLKIFSKTDLEVGQVRLSFQNRFQITSSPENMQIPSAILFDRLRIVGSISTNQPVSLLVDLRFDNKGIKGSPLVGATTDRIVKFAGATSGYSEVSFNQEQLSFATLYAKNLDKHGAQVQAFLFCNKLENKNGTCFVEGSILSPKLASLGKFNAHLSLGGEKADILNKKSSAKLIFGFVLKN